MADAASPVAMSTTASHPLIDTLNETHMSAGTVQFARTAGSEKDAGAALLLELYTRQYPTVDELRVDLEDLAPSELAEMVEELRTEVSALREETSMLAFNVTQLRARAPDAAATANTAVDINGSPSSPAPTVGSIDAMFTAAGSSQSRNRSTSNINAIVDGMENNNTTTATGTGGMTVSTRRGRGYRRRSQEESDALVAVTEKTAMLAKHRERLRTDEERAGRQAEHIQDLLTATVEEAQRRLQELRLEFRQFCREVLKGSRGAGAGASHDAAASRGHAGTTRMSAAAAATLVDGSLDISNATACADDLLLYMQRRVQSQNHYLDKLCVQCEAAERSIARTQQQVRQRRTAGEAFHAVDFAQLRIENEQFNDRIDKRNRELAELKAASTGAVQTLNSLMNALNDLSTEQAVLRKELRTRGEYLARCTKDVTIVSSEAANAEKKNKAIKSQHEAVKVPKIEEYIAQTAELFELQKACKNWSRKVEIAEGQGKVLRQQARRLDAERKAAVAYVQSKKQQRQATTQRSAAACSSGSVVGQGGRGMTTAQANPSARRSVSGGGVNAFSAIHAARAPAPADRKGTGGAAAAAGCGPGVAVGGTKSLLQMKRTGCGASASGSSPAGAPSAGAAAGHGRGRERGSEGGSISGNVTGGQRSSGSAAEGNTFAAIEPLDEAKGFVENDIGYLAEDASEADGDATHPSVEAAVAPTVAPQSPTQTVTEDRPSSAASTEQV